MVHYLGLVEQKANAILRNYTEIRQTLLAPAPGTNSSQYLGSVDKEDNLTSPSKAVMSLTSVLGVGPKVPMGQDLLHVNPPKLDDYQSEDEEDDDDDDARPLTRDELKARTLNRLQKKGLQGNGKGKSHERKNANKKLAATR
jgi:hypothetical protein